MTSDLSLLRVIQNLSDRTFSDITYDKNGRYIKLKNFKKAIQHQQRTTSVSLSSTIEERLNSIGKEFNLSSVFMKNQYELALKNRIEIPPILMRRIIIDAIGIFRIMINDFNQDMDKFQRISKHLEELEIYNQLFDHHC